MLPDRPPDRFELGVRFVCGALAGLVAGGIFALESTINSPGQLALMLAAPALVFGVCAAALGDRFWHGLARMMGSFWW